MKESKFRNLLMDKSLSSVYNEVDGLSLQNLFFTKNGYFPNCYMFTKNYKGNDNFFDVKKLFDYFLDKYNEDELEYIQYITHNIDTKEDTLGFCIVLLKQNLFARFEKQVNESYILYGHDDVNNLMDLVNTLNDFYVAPDEEKGNIWKIAQTSSGFCLQKGKIKEVKNFSIERQYNDDFPHEDEKIKKFIEDKNKSGLVILHGEKGTGKTTYIRNLINNNPSRKFVYVTPDLVTLLGQPAFTSFLNTLSDHIIILEDCENVIRDRKNTGMTSGVSTLLNMSDGLLADDLGIKFICTFNADVRDIDSALMRKGRLVSKYEFRPLTVEKTNALLEFVFTEKAKEENTIVDENGETFVEPVVTETEIPKVNKGLTLADIYNFTEDSYEVVRKKII